MLNVPIQPIPNQELFAVLDNNNWNISIKTTNGSTSVTLTLNGTVIVENARAVANEKIIQSDYLELGNFAFGTLNYEIPYYEQFGITQKLYYISPTELQALRQPAPSIITADYFSPIAPLPLRFSPQGY